MDRRTPPRHHWAALLRASFEGAAAQPDGTGDPENHAAQVDDLVTTVMADIERHAASASAVRNRVRAMRADAGAALQAAAIIEAASGPGLRPAGAAGQGGRGQALDVRR